VTLIFPSDAFKKDGLSSFGCIKIHGRVEISEVGLWGQRRLVNPCVVLAIVRTYRSSIDINPLKIFCFYCIVNVFNIFYGD
jgi:hypothetical protein